MFANLVKTIDLFFPHSILLPHAALGASQNVVCIAANHKCVVVLYPFVRALGVANVHEVVALVSKAMVNDNAVKIVSGVSMVLYFPLVADEVC